MRPQRRLVLWVPIDMREISRHDLSDLAAHDAPSVRATIRALAAPRRLIPTLLVCAALIAAQARLSHDPLATPLGLALCLAFVLVAPVSYRVLFARETRLLHGLVLLALYGAIGAGVVAVLGIAVPSLLHMAPTLLTERLHLTVCVALFLVGGWGLGRDIGFEERFARRRDARWWCCSARRTARSFWRCARTSIRTFCSTRSTPSPNGAARTARSPSARCCSLSPMLRAMLGGVRDSCWPLARGARAGRALFELHRLRDPRLFHLRRLVPAGLEAIVRAADAAPAPRRERDQARPGAPATAARSPSRCSGSATAC